MSLTSDPNDPRIRRGVDTEPVPQNAAYLVLSEAERAKGFVRPLRRTYVHRYWLDGSTDPLPTVLTIHHARDAFSRLVSAIRRGEPTGEWLGVLTGGVEA